MAQLNPAKFVREVRQETTKVTWPSRKETTIYTVMALSMAAIAATFFVLVDWIASTAVLAIIGI